MLLALGEKEWVLVAASLMRSDSTRDRVRLLTNIDWNLLPEQSLLRVELVLFVLHRIFPLIGSGESMTSRVTTLIKTVIFAYLLECELVLHCLTDHVFELVDISHVYTAALGLVELPTIRVHDDRHYHWHLLMLHHWLLLLLVRLVLHAGFAERRTKHLVKTHQTSFMDLHRCCSHVWSAFLAGGCRG